jgi:CRP/FNR family transcriptional regulator, anaerobic regulatory protein
MSHLSAMTETSGALRLDIHNSDVPRLCRACEARHKGVCGALEAPQLARLGRQARRQEAAPGTELVTAGVPTESYANILSGVVKLSKVMPDGRQQIVGLQFAPDFVGRPFSESSDICAEAAGTVASARSPDRC